MKLLCFDDTDDGTDTVPLSSVAIQCAQLLRSTRKTFMMGSVFHLANFEHWQCVAAECLEDMSPGRRQRAQVHLDRMACQLFLAMIQGVYRSGNLNDFQNLAASAKAGFVKYLNKLQARLDAQDYAVSLLDTVNILAIGVCLCFLSMKSNLHSAPSNLDVGPLRKCSEILTVAAERFSGARYFRDLLVSLTDTLSFGLQSYRAATRQLLSDGATCRMHLPGRDRELILSMIRDENYAT